VSLAPDGRRAVSASLDHALRVWDTEHGTSIATFMCESSPRACRMSPDGTIAAGDGAGRIYILALETTGYVPTHREEYDSRPTGAVLPK
jgi:WD40 repeat protein